METIYYLENSLEAWMQFNNEFLQLYLERAFHVRRIVFQGYLTDKLYDWSRANNAKIALRKIYYFL